MEKHNLFLDKKTQIVKIENSLKLIYKFNQNLIKIAVGQSSFHLVKWNTNLTEE